MLPFSYLPLVALALALLYLIIEGIYNVFFHPLKDYPGPFLAKINRWNWTFHAWNGNIVKRATELHEKYGDVVRVGPENLSYITAQAWQDIAGHRSASGTGNLPKDDRYRQMTPNGRPNIITANEQDHRRMRRLQSHMFSEKALAAQEPLIKGYVDMLISRLHEKARNAETNTVDLVKWYNYTTFDILGDLAFGDSFGCLASDVLHPWVANIFLSLKGGALYAIANQFSSPIFDLMMYLQPQNTKGAKVEEFAFASQRAQERMNQGGTDRVDFMSYILKNNDEKGMSHGEIESNASVLIIAGSETTATLLSGLTYHLLRSPHVLQTLTSLVRTAFPLEADINMVAVQQLHYLNACIEEGLRVYPPAAAGFPRMAPEGGATVCGRFVPAGTAVYVTQYAAHVSASNFTDPKEFVPERWLANPPARYADDNRKAMQPFSAGPRNCIGRNLAYGEIRLILARMLWNFDLELQNDCLNWNDQKVWMTWEKPPLNVKLVPRKF